MHLLIPFLKIADTTHIYIPPLHHSHFSFYLSFYSYSYCSMYFYCCVSCFSAYAHTYTLSYPYVHTYCCSRYLHLQLLILRCFFPLFLLFFFLYSYFCFFCFSGYACTYVYLCFNVSEHRRRCKGSGCHVKRLFATRRYKLAFALRLHSALLAEQSGDPLY